MYEGERIFYTAYQTFSKTTVTSAISYGKFSSLLNEFRRQQFALISLKENAELRIHKGKNSAESWTGNYVREGFLYIPHKGIFLVKNSPINDHVNQADDANMMGFEYGITMEDAEKALQDSVHIPYDTQEIAIEDLPDNPIAGFAFGEAVAEYALFLKEADITKWPIWIIPKGLVDTQPHPFVRQVIFRCMDNWSGIIGSNADLHRPYGVRAISYHYKGRIDDRDEVYSLADILNALKAASLSGLEGIVLRALRQSSSLPVNYAQEPFSWGSGQSQGS